MTRTAMVNRAEIPPMEYMTRSVIGVVRLLVELAAQIGKCQFVTH